jgi:hypothetical protein
MAIRQAASGVDMTSNGAAASVDGIAMCIARARLFHRQFMDMQQVAA